MSRRLLARVAELEQRRATAYALGAEILAELRDAERDGPDALRAAIDSIAPLLLLPERPRP